MDQIITISVTLDAKTFRRFAFFDAFAVKKHGRSPAIFSLILIVFSFIALMLKREQSGMIAAVLLVIGLGLPIIYAGSFLSQLNVQVERFKLGKGRKVYTVTLTEDGITVRNLQRAEADLLLPWSDVWRAYQRKDCVYLYATQTKAFLLPNGQADAPDEAVWRFPNQNLQRAKQSSSFAIKNRQAFNCNACRFCFF